MMDTKHRKYGHKPIKIAFYLPVDAHEYCLRQSAREGLNRSDWMTALLRRIINAERHTEADGK